MYKCFCGKYVELNNIELDPYLGLFPKIQVDFDYNTFYLQINQKTGHFIMKENKLGHDQQQLPDGIFFASFNLLDDKEEFCLEVKNLKLNLKGRRNLSLVNLSSRQINWTTLPQINVFYSGINFFNNEKEVMSIQLRDILILITFMAHMSEESIIITDNGVSSSFLQINSVLKHFITILSKTINISVIEFDKVTEELQKINRKPDDWIGGEEEEITLESHLKKINQAIFSFQIETTDNSCLIKDKWLFDRFTQKYQNVFSEILFLVRTGKNMFTNIFSFYNLTRLSTGFKLCLVSDELSNYMYKFEHDHLTFKKSFMKCLISNDVVITNIKHLLPKSSLQVHYIKSSEFQRFSYDSTCRNHMIIIIYDGKFSENPHFKNISFKMLIQKEVMIVSRIHMSKPNFLFLWEDCTKHQQFEEYLDLMLKDKDNHILQIGELTKGNQTIISKSSYQIIIDRENE